MILPVSAVPGGLGTRKAVVALKGPELGLEQSSVFPGDRGDIEEGRGWNVDLSPYHEADKGQNRPKLMFTEEAAAG